MPTILVTNDDGYRSEGIRALADRLREIGDVTVVAPMDEASAIGHALTLRRPLRLEAIADGVFGVDGTPTDCVNIAIANVLRRLPDLVVSGINKGWNLGDDVTYSGTVAGAMEGALLGIPSVAVSLRATRAEYDFQHAADAARRVAALLLQTQVEPRTFLNVNVPGGRPVGYRTTVQARRNHRTSVAERHDPKGRPYFWIEEGQTDWHHDERSDYYAVRQGFVSVTPLQPDLTSHAMLAVVDALTAAATDPEPLASRAARD